VNDPKKGRGAEDGRKKKKGKYEKWLTFKRKAKPGGGGDI